MLKDIVVDTNVFVHASNPAVAYCGEANSLIAALEGCQTYLCIDEGFSIEPARNQSKIGGEYLENLHFGMAGYNIVSQLAQTERIRFVPNRVNPSVSKKINQILRKARDKTFLKVAINSQGHFFCSHDFEDFSVSKRPEIKNLFDVRVKTAGETLPFLV